MNQEGIPQPIRLAQLGDDRDLATAKGGGRLWAFDA
jgi:hypothetical protein